MRVLKISKILNNIAVALGISLDQTTYLSTELIACCLRYASGFLCPCSEQALVGGVLDTLTSLYNDDDLKIKIEDTLEAIISAGDIIEVKSKKQNGNNSQVILLYTAPPKYVRRESDSLIILGTTPDHVPILPDEILKKIIYINHIRLLPSGENDDHIRLLSESGYNELKKDLWLHMPSVIPADEYLNKINLRLDSMENSVEIPNLQILDSLKSATKYRERWIVPVDHTSRFIARRPQIYGSDLWCYVEIKDGHPVKFIDLPVLNNAWRGCDEAWRIQMAIDSVNKSPQRYRVRKSKDRKVILDLFSPVPMWVRRRWDALGTQASPQKCLFSFSFFSDEVNEEINFINKYLWLTEIG